MKIIIYVFFIAIFFCGCKQNKNEMMMGNVSKVETITPAVLKGEHYSSPELTWPAKDGEMNSFRELTKGKVVLVNYWATWCIPCKISLASLRMVRQKFDKENLVILGIATYEQTESAYRLDFVSKFVAERDFGYPVLLDDDENSLWKAFGLEPGGVPSMVFINKKGIIEKTIGGSQSEDKIIKELEKLLL